MHITYITAIIAATIYFCICAPNATAETLSSFKRTNSETTKVNVSAIPKDATVVSPRIYSNFLEHLGNAVYDTLWANAVFNPQFAPNKNGELERWSLHEYAEWVNDGPAGHSMRLPEGGSISQLIYLHAYRQRKYRGSVWARAVGAETATIDFDIRQHDKPAVLSGAQVQINSSEWKQYKFSIVLPNNAIARGQATDLRIFCAYGDASIANVELFPADAVDGVDPEVLRAAKALHIELLRWPGGNFVSGYHWRDGVGPRQLRPTKPNPAWPGMEFHHFGTDEFMRFCKHIGAQPQICINAGNGTPEEAAAWVEYCNGTVETPMGKLRARNGHPAPYNVRVWEIGNELYGEWQIGFTQPTGNAERYARFSKAMLAVDPTIEILATGKGDGSTVDGVNSDNAWNHAVLKEARASGHVPQYLSLHPLVGLPGPADRFSYDEVYDNSLAHPLWWERTYIPQLRKLAKEELGANTNIMFAPTEWGVIMGGPNWPQFPNHDAQSGAVYGALFLNAMLRSAKDVGLSNVTALIHGGGIKRRSGGFYCDPLYYVSRAYGVARIQKLIPITVEGPAYDVPERAMLPAVNDVPYLDIVAGASITGERWIMVVNRDQHNARKAEITLPTKIRAADLETLVADARERNGLEHPHNVEPQRSTVKVDGLSLNLTFPPCSLTAIKLK